MLAALLIAARAVVAEVTWDGPGQRFDPATLLPAIERLREVLDG